MGMMFHFNDEVWQNCPAITEEIRIVQERQDRFETPEAKRQLRQLSPLDIAHLKTDLKVGITQPNFKEAR